MVLECDVLFLFILINISLASCVPPKILEETDDIIINAKDNYNLTCQGSEPLIWTYPLVTGEGKDNWTSYEIVSSKVPHNNYFTYRSVLHITNMSYPFVGFYTCQYESDSDYNKDERYLFVNDPEHLSIEDNYKLHYAAQHQETTIPCRPTHPDVQVQLISYSTEQGGITVELDKVFTEGNHFNTMYHFDSKTGFWTNDTVNETIQIIWFNCVFRNKNHTKALNFAMLVEEPRAFLAKPYIEDISHNHTDAGQTLNLKCFLQESSRNIIFDWITPRGTFSASNTKETKRNSEVKITKKARINGKDYLISHFFVYNTTLGDEGNYSCVVSDRQNNKASSKEYIMIHDVNNCFIKIREENDQSNISAEAGEDVQWILEVTAHPVPELIWFDNTGNMIKNDTTYYTDFTLGKAVFKIKNVSLENDGSYKVKGKTSRGYTTPNCPKETDFEVMLNVYDKPVVCLDSQKDCKIKENQLPKIYLLNEIVYIKCQAKGNPLPSIVWKHKKCLEEKCNFIEVNGTKQSTPQKFVRTSYHKVDTTKEGIVRCIAFNSYGNDASTIMYYISDVKDGFDIYNFGDKADYKMNKTTTEVIVAVDSTLMFTCAVSPQRSDSVEIFYNNKLLSEKYSRNYLNDAKSHKITITLHQAKTSDSGVYSCRIRNLYNQLYEYKNVTFSVKDPAIPNIWATNLNKEVIINYPNMSCKLYCNYTGIPKAYIEWYKDNERIWPSKRIIMEENDSILKFVKTEVSDEGFYRCMVSNAIGKDFKEAPLKFKGNLKTSRLTSLINWFIHI